MARFSNSLSRIGITYKPAFLLGLTSMFISFATRLTLFFISGSNDSSVMSLSAGFLIGVLYDLITTLFVIIPLLLQLCFQSEFIYSSKGRKWILTGFILLLCLLLFTSLVPKEYSRDLYKGLVGYIFLRLALYLALNFAGSSLRNRWRSGSLALTFGLTVYLLLLNAVSEYFFWNEFSSRYNFIAVDYLVYTNEVIGNIKESYPLYTILAMIAAVTLIIVFSLRSKLKPQMKGRLAFPMRLAAATATIAAATGLAWLIPPDWQYFSSNNYADEIAGNGPYDFVQAFNKNELDFYKYYQTIPDEEAFSIVKNKLKSQYASLTSGDPFDISRNINYPGEEKKMNVVLISVESLSASFMGPFGNDQHLTPNLDSLAEKGLLFTNLYASGTRTVRGLEALSLSIPPLPGQSLVKRPANENLFSLGGVFRSKGYNTQYIYGGYSYFDNMNYFFSHNNYQVVDRSALSKKDVHYANIWGVADEDLFTLALREIDSNDRAHKPFFTQIMTVSNHRPYTYPDNRIDIPPSSQTRDGAVKYTDYAIGRFIKQASSKPWFGRTVFVIVADHCASSSGKTALPVTGYHIPMIIYSPGNIHPDKIHTLTAQIDIAPTILGLLQMDYRSKFFGRDVLHEPATEAKAFISTYQGLGFLKNDSLVVQSPVRHTALYRADLNTGAVTELLPDNALQKEATSFYQVAAWLIRHKKYAQ